MYKLSLFGLLAASFSCHAYYEAGPIEEPERCLETSPSYPNCNQVAIVKEKTPPREANVSDGRFVVHEWGTFTSLVDENGKTFTWYPLLGSKPLPRFVNSQWFQTVDGQWHWGKGWDFDAKTEPIQGTVRMETPVMYFYSDKERDLSVEVKFNNGYITEWFPHAAVPIQNPNVIKWNKVHLTPGAKEEYPSEDSGSEYYAARETDATPLVSTPPPRGDQSNVFFSNNKPPSVSEMIADGHANLNDLATQPQREKFLFYRGVGSFGVPLSAAIVSSTNDEQKLVLKNQQSEDIPGMILFMRKGDKIWFQVLDGMKQGESKPVTLNLTASPSGIEPVKEALISLLTEQNLYGREAKAMVKTWEEAWFEEGLRVFYIVPRPTTEKILPLSISEEADELERVLVGRIDVLTPELRKEIEASTKEILQLKLSPEQLASAPETQKLLARGRFVQPVIFALQNSTKDEDQKLAISTLLQELPRLQAK
jgi:hypothetical protein